MMKSVSIEFCFNYNFLKSPILNSNISQKCFFGTTIYHRFGSKPDCTLLCAKLFF